MITHEQLGFLLNGIQPGAFVLRAQPHSLLVPDQYQLWQSFYPTYQALQAQGHQPEQDLARLPINIKQAYLVGSRHKDENRSLIATLASKLASSSTLTTLLPNDLGAKSLEADLRDLFGTNNVTVTSKHHSRRMVATKTPDLNSNLQKAWQNLYTPAQHVDNTFYTQPGIFSWRAVDEGSHLLAEYLPTNLQGQAADLGAGWGYLTHQLLLKNPTLHIDLYEAEALALNCAKLNLAPYGHQCQYHWADATKLPNNKTYDIIITNPPVHDLHSSDVGLGVAFVQEALQRLNRKGQLFIVANRHLPYEGLLKGYTTQTLAQTGQYKIIHAVR
jgi:16S rRNA (guanine1207-N2)-methyltransferase